MKTKLIRIKETIPKKTIKMLEKINNITCTMLFLSQHCQYQFDEKKREEILEDIMKLNEKTDELVSSNWH